jgi:coenzyme F420-reducing hydrogenase gamma subunit
MAKKVKKTEKKGENEKLKFGFFSFTCCEGCLIVFVEALNKKFDDWMKKMEVTTFRALKPFKELEKLDYAIVEGSISTKSEMRKIKEIRKLSKRVVAIGSGAINGYPSNQRNNLKGKELEKVKPMIKTFHQLPKILPIKEVIKVDDEIPGCPVDREEVIKKFDSYLKTKK